MNSSYNESTITRVPGTPRTVYSPLQGGKYSMPKLSGNVTSGIKASIAMGRPELDAVSDRGELRGGSRGQPKHLRARLRRSRNKEVDRPPIATAAHTATLAAGGRTIAVIETLTGFAGAWSEEVLSPAKNTV